MIAEDTIRVCHVLGSNAQ